MTVNLLEAFEVKAPTTHAGVTIFPVFGGTPLPSPVALADQGIVISEKESAEVPVLVATNTTDSPVLLLEGEVLHGGRQTRTLNVSVLVPAQSTIELPVSCVEAGRWGGGRSFSRGGYQVSRRVRSAKTRGVGTNVRGPRRSKESHQGAVWHSVSDELTRFKAAAETDTSSFVAAYAAAYRTTPREVELDVDPVELERDRRIEEARQEALDRLIETGPVAGQTGVVVALGDEVVAAEVFGTPELLEARWAEIVRSLLLDAREDDGAEAGIEAAEQFLRALGTGDTVVAPGVGLGEELHVQSPTSVAQALVWDSALVHASAFSSLD